MDQFRTLGEAELRLRHRHADGSYGVMTEGRQHHDPVEHDIERDWANHRIYTCEACGEGVVILPDTQEETADRG